MLDVLLATNISLSLLILLTSVYVQRPLDFSSFPTVLLITTLFRLSLNVATTRRILLYGNKGTAAAGHIIQAFGQFVVGGNYIVGFVVFLILVIINFVVITKGAQRIAEVAARFTLDAMPGKQMAVDADLNAGLIDEAIARKRRDDIRREADFYGAMDGASKFVRGDAIAGVIITVINIRFVNNIYRDRIFYIKERGEI
jgi:flagellar biosynthesis protein FlhA